MSFWRNMFGGHTDDLDNRDDDSDNRDYVGRGHHRGSGGNHHRDDEYYDRDSGLTHRQVEVLRAVLALGSKEAAEHLGLSRSTVKKEYAEAKERAGLSGDINDVWRQYKDMFNDSPSYRDYEQGGRYANQDVDDVVEPDSNGDFY